ncbi:MAG: hypothetical protein ACREOI_13510 [bacterium]
MKRQRAAVSLSEEWLCKEHKKEMKAQCGSRKGGITQRKISSGWKNPTDEGGSTSWVLQSVGKIFAFLASIQL